MIEPECTLRLVEVAAPAAEPLSVAEVRARLGIGAELTDDTLTAFIKSARQTIDGADGWLGRALITQTWKLVGPHFPFEPIKLPLPPYQSIVSLKYVDPNGVQQTMDPSLYQVQAGGRSYLLPAYGTYWPSARWQDGAVEITFKAGYGDAGSSVPEPIRQAIVLMVSHMRSLSSRDQSVMADNVVGVSSKTYATGRDAGADLLTAAAQSLLSTYQVYA
jgi:uncharacterized phiE125 gp8 family phage protein